jgi:hypothetical protein
MTEQRSLGRAGYDAYGECPNAHGPWKTYDGREMPTWDQLSESDRGQETQMRWETAANTIVLRYMTQSTPVHVSTLRPDQLAEYVKVWAESFGFYVDAGKLFDAIKEHDGEIPIDNVLTVERLLRDFRDRAATIGVIVDLNEIIPAITAGDEPRTKLVQPSIHTSLIKLRTRVHNEVKDGRQRAIIVRYLEDAICRLSGEPHLPQL